MTNTAASSWHPTESASTRHLRSRLGTMDEQSRENLVRESLGILEECLPPGVAGSRTGLVVGHVQSGKTASFTAVTALARDNGYQLVIILSGLTVNLFQQSVTRLKHDLATEERRGFWRLIDNPRVARDRAGVQRALHEEDEDERQTVVLVVMKQKDHLDQLTTLLGGIDLGGASAIVVDDEADQASPNAAQGSGKQSATYRRILELRAALPSHTYLQYTATPQAPLLISLIDALSPEFVRVLTPGSAYTGGEAFFGTGTADLARTIPADELPDRDNPLADPPASLHRALLQFFVGVAVGLVQDQHRTENRSMLVNPSSKREPHNAYQGWVEAAKRCWEGILKAGPADPDYRDLLEDFRAGYDDLAATDADLPPFDQIADKFPAALRRTDLTVVNAGGGRTPEPIWTNDYAHILVGGNVLSRGYTVRGLTISYMPRPLGSRQADTIQQRARWFGYKDAYLGLCRVYLPLDARNAYRSYLDHEDEMRRALLDWGATGRSLREWRRQFFLDPKLRPTRASVVGLHLVAGAIGGSKWFDPKRPYLGSAPAANRDVVTTLRGRIRDELVPNPLAAGVTPAQRHSVARGLSLADVHSEFLTNLRWEDGADSAAFTGLLLQVQHELEGNPEATCSVVLMGDGEYCYTRSLNVAGAVENLFQGHNPAEDGRGYPGHRAMHFADDVTIQIYRTDLREDPSSAPIHLDIPTVAIYLPKRMTRNWLVEDRAVID